MRIVQTLILKRSFNKFFRREEKLLFRDMNRGVVRTSQTAVSLQPKLSIFDICAGLTYTSDGLVVILTQRNIVFGKLFVSYFDRSLIKMHQQHDILTVFGFSNLFKISQAPSLYSNQTYM